MNAFHSAVKILGVLLCFAACTMPQGEVQVLGVQDLVWEHLNPARGAASPSAATLWGDRNGNEATGFLLRPADGFSSPPHLHNVSYRGVVIRGLLHNDDPDAAKMWMPPGSYWTQPAGEVHITAAQGEDVLAYIEIEGGPYLVKPTEEAFDNCERSVNVDPSNLRWVGAASTTWLKDDSQASTESGLEMAFLWAEEDGSETQGNLIKVPAGHHVEMQSRGSSLRAVLIQGKATYQWQGSQQESALAPGSSFSSLGTATHRVTASASGPSVFYLRTVGDFRVVTVNG